MEETPHLRLVLQGGSFADQQRVAIGANLEALIAAAHEVLELAAPDSPITVYLGDVLPDASHPDAALTTGSYAVPERREVWCVFRADAPGIDLERTMLALLIDLRTGQDPKRAPLLLDGLMGVIGQTSGQGPPSGQLAAMLTEAIASGMPLSLTELLSGPTDATERLYLAAATAFAGWFLAAYGPQSYLKLLTIFDPLNPDAAARAASGHSFAALEKRWLAALRKSAPSVGGIGRFLRTSLVYLRPYRLKQVEIIVYILFGIAFTQVLPLAERYLIDNALTTRKDTGLLVKMLVAGLVLFFVMGLASLRQSYLSAEIGEGVLRDLRRQMFSRLQDLSAGFFSRVGTGDIISRMSNDLAAVEFALTGALLQGLVLVLTFLASLASLLYLNWKLTLIALVALPFFSLITRFLGAPASRASRERQERLSDVTTVLQENVTAQSVIRAYGLKGRFIREWMDQTAGLYRSAIRLNFLGSLFGLSASLLTTLIQVLAFGVGGYFVIKGQVSLGTLVAFLSLLGGLIAPAQSLSGVAQALQQGSGAMDRVLELLSVEPQVADRPGAKEIGALGQAITFDNVRFSYTGTEPQLDHVSFTIPAGASVALVGPSGSGKSTVTNLVLRFYDAEQGSVRMDGVDLRDIQLDSLRRQIGIVFQESFLFNRSIRENIRFGREDATDVEVEAAAQAAEVHEFVASLPQGYDTVVGERGSSLSGGQRQRLALARAILRNPSVLVLDEATSALDPRTENAINHTLASLSRGRTTISVTHRLAGAATADRIYVLDRGSLVEEGTHAALLAASGLYARLWEEQTGKAPHGMQQLALEMEALRRVPIFARLDSGLLAGLAAHLFTSRMETGEVIVRAGEAGDRLFLLVAGEADVIGRDPAGNERLLNLLRPGDYFGEIALLYDVPRSATVRARTQVTLYALDKQDFLVLLEAVPGMRRLIEESITDREVAYRTTSPQAGLPTGSQPDEDATIVLMAPLKRGQPRLIVETGVERGRSYPLNDQYTGIGRNATNDIVLMDREVSGFHARIERHATGRFALIDSGSTNGTTLEGKRVAGLVELRQGDIIGIGQMLMRFDIGG